MNGKDFLDAHGISQSMLAEELGITRQAVSLWIRGERAPTAKSIKKIADAMTNLGATVSPSEVYTAMLQSATEREKKNCS